MPGVARGREHSVILIVAVAVSVFVALLRGGHLGRLADLRIRYAGLVLAAVVLQYPLVYNILRDQAILGAPVATLMMAGSYGLLLWAVWANRRLPGIPLVVAGMLANLVVMAANGGWMPITPEALGRLNDLNRVVQIGHTAKVWGAKNVMLARAETRLWWLSDIFVLSSPFPVPAVFSIGDVVIALGGFWLVQHVLVQRAGCPVGAASGAD